MEEANKLIGAGKKHLVMGKAVEAVNSLQEACRILAKTFGDTADECGEAFLWCGKALLDLARMENSVLGNALEGVPEEEEEDEEGKTPKDSAVDGTENMDETTRDELRDQVYDAMAEKKEEDKVEEKRSGEGGADECEEEKRSEGDKGAPGGEEKTEDGEEGKESGDEGEAAEGDEDGEEEEEEGEEGGEGGADEEMEDKTEEKGADDAEKDSEDEEVGNLQLAWEMLEVAKVIYKRKETKDDQLMAAQAHLKLGEVSVESGNYAQALDDFQECLKLQQKHLDADSRLIAATHYQLGLTYALNLQHGRVVAEFDGSIAVIQSRLGKLRGLLEGAEGGLAEERKELEELEALLPEIQEKLEDANEMLRMVHAAGGDASSSGSILQNGESSKVDGPPAADAGASTAPVSDISHLVRKKRKPEESPAKEGEAKKMKQDGGGEAHAVNGAAEAKSP